MQPTTIPFPKRAHAGRVLQPILLACGIVSSALYVAMNIFVPMQFPGYSSASQTVSELSAIDAPTRPLWVLLGSIYTLLIAAFGWGVLQSAAQRSLRIAGILLVVYGLIGLAWPPMHQREVLAAGGGTFTDTMHIVFTAVTVMLMLSIIGFCAASLGKNFGLYSIATLVLMLVFGILTGIDSPKLEAGLPTPLIGVWERINIGAYVLWIAVLSVVLLKVTRKNSFGHIKDGPIY